MGIEELLLDLAKKEGFSEAIEQGRREGAVTVAISMKKEEMPLAQISKYTGLSLNEIEKL